MFFRFSAALFLVVLISLAGSVLEKRNLELKRAVTRQHYRRQVLEEQYVACRVSAQELGAPARLIGDLDPELLAPAPPERPEKPARRAQPAKQQRASGRH